MPAAFVRIWDCAHHTADRRGGALVTVKGLRYLVAAMPEILRRCPDTHLVLAGDGDQRPRLEAVARDAAVPTACTSWDSARTPPPSRPLWMCSSYPRSTKGGSSPRDGHGTRRPVVATRVGGVPEVVQDGGQGLLVPAADPRALACAIAAILNDRDEASAMGEAGRQRAELFSAEVMLERHLRLYRGEL